MMTQHARVGAALATPRHVTSASAPKSAIATFVATVLRRHPLPRPSRRTRERHVRPGNADVRKMKEIVGFLSGSPLFARLSDCPAHCQGGELSQTVRRWREKVKQKLEIAHVTKWRRKSAK